MNLTREADERWGKIGKALTYILKNGIEVADSIK